MTALLDSSRAGSPARPLRHTEPLQPIDALPPQQPPTRPPASLPTGSDPGTATVIEPARLDAIGRRLATTAAAVDQAAAFPFDHFATLHREGLIAAVVPAAAGGGGASLATARQIITTLGRAEASTALVLTMTWLVHRALARPTSRWPSTLRDIVWQSAVAEGGLANNLRVEPQLGSPARGGVPATLARRTGRGWILSGHKLYCTGIPGLSWLLVHARTDGVLPDVGTFLVPRHLPGIHVIENWDALGLRASGSHEVVFDQVEIPADHAVDLRPPADWHAGPEPDQVAWMAVLLGALYDGVARAARDWLGDFLANRVPANLGKPLSTVPRIQQVSGEIEALLATNDALLDGLSGQVDAGRTVAPTRSALVKYSVGANAIRVVDLALQLSGNHGLSRRNPLERHHRDVLCSRIHTPQDDSVLTGAGKAALEAWPVA